VYFQFKYNKRLPPFLLIHKQEHVKCLSEFFEVTVVQNDCNFAQICDTYRPDLALFESGVNHETCQRLRIDGVRARTDVPKVGLHHADAFCNARAGFLSDMDNWGIETFFAISTTAAEHTPEIADNLFVWPVFIDASVYRDYGLWKSVPVLLTGNTNALYPWRRQVFSRISQHFPSLVCPHSGYEPRRDFAHILVGERYARTINASWCAPTCGTIAKEAIRKHFEIPGCRACLITERSAALEAAGFIDMVNCVFTDERDAVDRIAWLFENPDTLNSIIDAGHQLVHSRHTLKHRDQIFRWFELQRIARADQRIVQRNPFDAPYIVDRSSGTGSAHIASGGRHLELLREGRTRLREGKYEEAESLFRKCANHARWMPEPKLAMALCSLYRGDAKAALDWIEEPIRFVLDQYHAVDPDPVEWAYLIISLMCQGKLDTAVKQAARYDWLVHPELDRARAACGVLASEGGTYRLPTSSSKRRRTMHQMPERTSKEWGEQLCIMLSACGQDGMAHAFKRLASDAFARALQRPRQDGGALQALLAGQPAQSGYDGNRKMPFSRKSVVVQKVGSVVRKALGRLLHRLEAKWGYFLPYRMSEMRNDEFFKAVLDLSQEETIANALLIGASCGQGCTEALLTGTARNPNKPVVFCVSGSEPKFRRSSIANANSTRVKWYDVSADQHGSLQQKLEDTINAIMEEHDLDSFDAVVIDSDAFGKTLDGRGLPLKELHRAKLVLLDDVSGPYNYKTQRALRADSSYELLAENPSLRNGYAIFRKVAAVNAPALVSAIAE
jgi:hypothetical protein